VYVNWEEDMEVGVRDQSPVESSASITERG